MRRCALYYKSGRDPRWIFVATDSYMDWEREEFRYAAKRFGESDLSFGQDRTYIYIDMPTEPPSWLTDAELKAYKEV